MTETYKPSQKHAKVTNPVFSIQENPNLLGFARAKPGDKSAPVVIHLVQWKSPPENDATVELKTDRFFGGRPLSVRLLTPAAYDQAEHDDAERKAEARRKAGERRGAAQAEAYIALVKATPLQTRVEGASTFVTVPPLDPWGILIIEAAE